MFNLMFCRRAGAQRPPPLENFQDELCVLVKQFSKVAANYAQQKSRSRGQAFSAQSRELANSTCAKLKEAKHSRSVWSVVPASYILGKATLAPVSVLQNINGTILQTTESACIGHYHGLR